MSFWSSLKAQISEIANISDNIDTEKAAEQIRSSIYFKGPNVWILAFAVVIASVGLNINSTAVIIGAMLISPLMGPIFGIGLGLGANDTRLIREAAKNLLIMVLISLAASFLYFLITPLNLINPTELEARTYPTIFDVLIALFGGAAGIFEMSRKEKGTVISGVAIATALMPPICTAGYGLANGNFHYFGGALYLFLINTIFITLATYLMTKYLNFNTFAFQDEVKEKRVNRLITVIVTAVMVPSCLTAFNMIRANNFEGKANAFIAANKALDHSFIYDSRIDARKGGKVEVFMGGEPLKAYEKEALLASARSFGIKDEQVSIREHGTETEATDSEKLMQGIYERTDLEINKREAQIRALEGQLKELQGSEIPYGQISKEVRSQYPDIKDLFLTRGASVKADSTSTEQRCVLVVAKSDKAMAASQIEKLTDWLRIRLNDSTVVVINNCR